MPELRNLRGPSAKPLDEMGFKEIGRQGILLAEAALKAAAAQLAATEETNRLLRLLLPKETPPDA